MTGELGEGVPKTEMLLVLTSPAAQTKLATKKHPQAMMAPDSCL